MGRRREVELRAIPQTTVSTNTSAWKYWTEYCASWPTSPVRDDQDALDGTDKIGYAREIELVAGFIIWSHMTMKARGGRAAPQPQSAMNRY